MIVLISDQAHLDLDGIENWYFEKGEHLSDLFYKEFENLIIFIGRFPDTGHELADGFRIYFMRRFQYLILCEMKLNNIEVLHVIHEKRHPNLKFKRIK